jgi:CxxC motif-containing protein (DUF1111 family)
MQLFAIDPTIQETVPADANVVAQRRTTPLFGLGLIEAIPDSSILQNAKSFNPDGVTGRASIVQDVASATAAPQQSMRPFAPMLAKHPSPVRATFA